MARCERKVSTTLTSAHARDEYPLQVYFSWQGWDCFNPIRTPAKEDFAELVGLATEL